MEFEAPSVWRIASKHTVTFHNLAALGLKRPPQSLSTSPRAMPRPQRALDVVSDKASKNLAIWRGTESSNPAPSSRESDKIQYRNRALLRIHWAAARIGTCAFKKLRTR